MGYSAIMPTMWKSSRTEGMLVLLEKSAHVKEILLIDNAPSERNVEISQFKKLQHFPQTENIYVNPAWNLGYEKSSGEFLAILNDDITFDIDPVFELLLDHLDEVGLVGVNPACYGDGTNVALTMTKFMPQGGFGTAIFMRRDRYVLIPKELKVWFGDNWLFNKQTKPNFMGGFEIQTEMSTTVNQIPQRLTHQDIANWQNMKRKHARKHKLTLL